MARAQLPLSVLEVALGVVFVLAVTVGFALGLPAPDAGEPQLDAYARDAATILATEPPSHGGATRLSEVVASESAFERERAALRRRVERILPANLLFQVETPHGTVGYRLPRAVTTGQRTVTTAGGAVTVRVWYA